MHTPFGFFFFSALGVKYSAQIYLICMHNSVRAFFSLLAYMYMDKFISPRYNFVFMLIGLEVPHFLCTINLGKTLQELQGYAVCKIFSFIEISSI
jgi:hypothetical protein